MLFLIALLTNGVYFKVIWLILFPVLVLLIGSLKADNIKKENFRVQSLVSKFKDIHYHKQSVFVDEFEFSLYDGLLQNFTKGNKADFLKVKIFSDRFEFIHRTNSLVLEFRHLQSVLLLTENRGKYGAVIDKFISLSFDEKSVVNTINDVESDDIIAIVRYWRIRKSNGKVYGNSDQYFEKRLISTFERYVERL
jgi:hypothetical protein